MEEKLFVQQQYSNTQHRMLWVPGEVWQPNLTAQHPRTYVGHILERTPIIQRATVFQSPGISRNSSSQPLLLKGAQFIMLQPWEGGKIHSQNHSSVFSPWGNSKRLHHWAPPQSAPALNSQPSTLMEQNPEREAAEPSFFFTPLCRVKSELVLIYHLLRYWLPCPVC